jgi:ERCC4-type nuclease
MRVIIDERETELYNKCILLSETFKNVQIIKRVLHIGDILIETNDETLVLLIERKSFSDLLSSIKDGRYEEQSYRLLHSSGIQPHSIIYLIEGMFSQVKPIDKKLIYSTMTSLGYFKGFSTQRTSSVMDSAEWILFMADKLDRDLLKGKPPYYLTQPYLKSFSPIINNDSGEPALNVDSPELTKSNYCTVVKKVKKDNITPDNIGEIILCQIPGISSVTAIAIMKQFKGFSNFILEIQNNPKCLENITIESAGGKTRKINKSSIENIFLYLQHKSIN